MIIGRLLHAALFSVALSGCTLHGPRLTPVSHLAYNEAVQISEQRELLLNLVRLRYNDAPEFLAINSIASQLQFDASASLSGGFGDDAGNATRLFAPGAAAGYSESPTVTFSPLRSDEFTRRLVAPVELDSLYLLMRYGWGVERTLRLLADEINGVRNLVSRESGPAQDSDSIEQFTSIVRLMQSLNSQRLMDFDVVERWIPLVNPVPASEVSVQDLLGVVADGHRLRYIADPDSYSLESLARHHVLRLAPEALASPDLATIVAWLDLRPGASTYEISTQHSSDPAPLSSLTIRTRSVLGAMTYAAQGVVIPRHEIERGQAAPSAWPDSLHPPLLEVHHNEALPKSAFLAVPYRGRWFYIDGGDLESRRTLGALNSLMRLEIGAGSNRDAPVLTLPVAR